MPSIGHVAVGLAAGRLYRRGSTPTPGQLGWSMLAFSAISVLPDADAVGFLLGVHYEDPWGHRGATHSLLFALLVGTATAVVGRALGQPTLKLWLLATATAASHGLLDCLTNGGLGCALLWPVSMDRFFAPLRPIPVAPIGLHLLSTRGLLVVAVELVMFLPFFVYATFPRRRA